MATPKSPVGVICLKTALPTAPLRVIPVSSENKLFKQDPSRPFPDQGLLLGLHSCLPRRQQRVRLLLVPGREEVLHLLHPLADVEPRAVREALYRTSLHVQNIIRIYST